MENKFVTGFCCDRRDHVRPIDRVVLSGCPCPSGPGGL